MGNNLLQIIGILLLFLLTVSGMYGQVINVQVVDAQADREAVVQALAGDGVTISNITFGCEPGSFGSFQDGFQDITAGFTMATGIVENLLGPNISDNYPSPTTGVGTEPDLSAIVTETMRDVRIVEFDLETAGDSLRFNYLFGSEEYPEFVCAEFNDVFGFFISGPGINGTFSNNAVNIARIPGSNDPITVNTVNGGMVGMDGDLINCTSLDNTEYYIDNTGGLNHELDGTTVSLTTGIRVKPCATYHLKLAIADVKDSSYDSAVFIEEGSLVSSGGAISYSTGYFDPVSGLESAVRECVNAEVMVQIFSDVEIEAVVEIGFGMGLMEGVDFDEVADVFSIGAGESNLIFQIVPMNSQFASISDSILLEVSILTVDGCELIPPEPIYIPVLPAFDPQIDIPTSICEGDTIFLSATGAPSILWTPASVVDDPSASSTFALLDQTGTINFSSTFGVCDFSQSVEVTVLTEDPTLLDFDLCPGDSLMINGNMIGAAGNYLVSEQSVLGCDSIVDITLTVLSDIIQIENANICQGESFFVGGADQTVGGDYEDIFTASNGCDSLVTTFLTVFPKFDSESDVAICSGDSVFLQNQWQQSNGMYFDTLPAMNNCDSVVITHLLVNEAFDFFSEIFLCEGDSAFVDNAWQKESATFIESYLSQGNCDSTVTVELFVTAEIIIETELLVCEGDSVMIDGNWESAATIVEEEFLSSSNCDSIVRTEVIMQTSYEMLSEELFLCTGDSVFVDGNWQFVNGVFEEQLQTIGGCDSIRQTTLNFSDFVLNELPVSICEGENYFAEDALQTLSGMYFDTLMTASGCDSIVATNLLVVSEIFQQRDTSICDGEAIQLGATLASATGVYLQSETSIGGCDSLIEWNLMVQATFLEENVINLCEGELFFAEGAMQSEPGLYSDVFVSQLGCDSIIETELQFSSAHLIESSMAICPGDSVFLDGEWRYESGFFVENNSTAMGSCDSIIQTTLEVVDAAFLVNSRVLCPGEEFEFAGEVISQAGTYCDTSYLGPGCLNTVCLVVEAATPLDLELPADVSVLPGQPYSFDLNQEYFYDWSGNTGLSCNDCANPELIATTDVTLAFSVEDENGCRNDFEVTIDVIEEVELTIPSAFSPNNDGLNDGFGPLWMRGGKEIRSFSVYNRWGELLFESSGTEPNDVLQWDGTFKGDPCEIGVYVYQIDLRLWNGESEIFRGDVTLIR